MAIETGSITINSTELYYRRANPTASDTIFLLHAGICDSRMWQTQLEYFSTDYQVIAVDMHSFGQSGIPSESFSFHADFFALLDHFGIEQTWIMAASLGGIFAFEMAVTRPNHIKGLLLSAPGIVDFVHNGEAHPLVAKIDEADDVGDLDLVNELEIQMWVDGEGRSADDMNPEMRQLVLDMNLIALQADDSFWELSAELSPPVSERLSKITMPVLLIYGDLDIPASMARVNFIADGIPHAEKVLMSGTAHLPNMEQPEQFNQIVQTFLDNH
ncbi:MAG: alpha/beta hydrolase [Chloroflexota bacterium]